MSSIQLPPLSVQDAELTAANNSSILSTFFMGSYSTVYLGTIYLYATRKAPQRKIVITAITALYLIALIQFAVQWYLAQSNFIKTSNGTDSAYIALFDYPAWSHIVIDVTSFAMFSVADGLLIWRCYNAWGGSYLIIALPSLFLFLEIGFAAASIIYIFIVHLSPDVSQINLINDLQSAVFFLSFAASLTTTVLIAYRIYSSARDIAGPATSWDTTSASASVSASVSAFPSVFASPSPSGSASRSGSGKLSFKFTHVLEIIIQSAAIYSLVLLVAAISGVIPVTGDGLPSPSIFALSAYSSCLLVPAAGMAPTIMVARVSLASRKNTDHVASQSQMDVLSNLRFGVGSANHNLNDTRNIDWRVASRDDYFGQNSGSRYTGEEKFSA